MYPRSRRVEAPLTWQANGIKMFLPGRDPDTKVETALYLATIDEQAKHEVGRGGYCRGGARSLTVFKI